MKVTLLNDGGYTGLEKVQFPVEVEGELLKRGSFSIKGEELIAIGGEYEAFDPSFGYWFSEDWCRVKEIISMRRIHND